MTDKLNFCILLLVLIQPCSPSHSEIGLIPQNQDSAFVGIGKVHSFSGSVNTGRFNMPEKDEPVKMAYEFFELNRERFHISNPREELAYVRSVVSELSGTKCIEFKQIHKGVSVDAGAWVWYDSDGRLQDAKIKYYDISELSTVPQIDSANAQSLALKHTGVTERTQIFKNDQYSTKLSIWRDNNGRYRLIWVVWVDQQPGHHFWQYYVDAHDGSILQRLDYNAHD